MKNALLFIGLSCLTWTLAAQSYRPFPLGNARWHDVHTIWFSVHGIEYSQSGDTLVPGYELSKKLYGRRTFSRNWANPALDTVYHESPELLGAISQDTAARKVYFTAWNADPMYYPPAIPQGVYPLLDSTVLLYNFDLDILEAVGWIPEPHWFWNTTPIQLKDSTWSRRHEFMDDDFLPDTNYFWLEGIGGSYGLFTPLIDARFTDVSSGLACFSGNDIPLYPAFAGSCEGLPTSIAEKPDTVPEVLVFPNPASDRVFVEIPADLLPAVVVIFDVHGRRLAGREVNVTRTEISLENVPFNMPVLIQITTKSGRSSSKMLIRVP
jgi:hypothetical protein